MLDSGIDSCDRSVSEAGATGIKGAIVVHGAAGLSVRIRISVLLLLLLLLQLDFGALLECELRVFAVDALAVDERAGVFHFG